MKKTGWIVVLILVVFGFYYLGQSRKTGAPGTFDKTSGTINNTNTDRETIETSNLLLEITSPKDKSTVSSLIIRVEGKTAVNAEVFVNEKELKADILGNFSIDYELFEGENDIFVSANDSQGNYAEKTITVYLESTE